MTLDSVVGNLYSNYNIGRQFPLIIKRSGDFYVQSRSKLTEDKFWDSKTKTFLKLDRSASYSSRSSKEKVEAAKKRWRGLYSFYNIFDNFGYEGYYNDEIEQRTAHDYNSAFALSFSYAQKAENKFTKVYNGVKLEQFDIESKPKMNKSQEAEVRTLADKAIFFTDKAIEFAKSEDEKRKANHYLARFKTNMFAMFEIYAKKVDINEWLTDDLYEKQIIEHEPHIKEICRAKGHENINKIRLYKGMGCKVCGDTGYSGRIGIFEVLEMAGNIKDMVIRQASSDEIMKTAQENNMTTMFEDGMEKVFNGITTFEEVLRVTRE